MIAFGDNRPYKRLFGIEKLPLVSKRKDDFYNQHEISGGWLVVTHSATITKRQQLEKISKQLNLGLKIDIIE